MLFFKSRIATLALIITMYIVINHISSLSTLAQGACGQPLPPLVTITPENAIEIDGLVALESSGYDLTFLTNENQLALVDTAPLNSRFILPEPAQVTIWNLAGYFIEHEIKVPSESITNIVYYEPHQAIYYIDSGGIIRRHILNNENNDEIIVEIGERSSIDSMIIVEDGQRLILIVDSSTLIQVDLNVNSYSEIFELPPQEIDIQITDDYIVLVSEGYLYIWTNYLFNLPPIELEINTQSNTIVQSVNVGNTLFILFPNHLSSIVIDDDFEMLEQNGLQNILVSKSDELDFVGLTINSDQSLAFIANSDGAIEIWNLSNQEQISKFRNFVVAQTSLPPLIQDIQLNENEAIIAISSDLFFQLWGISIPC